MDVRDRLAAIQASWAVQHPHQPLRADVDQGIIWLQAGRVSTAAPVTASDADLARHLANLGQLASA